MEPPNKSSSNTYPMVPVAFSVSEASAGTPSRAAPQAFKKHREKRYVHLHLEPRFCVFSGEKLTHGSAGNRGNVLETLYRVSLVTRRPVEAVVLLVSLEKRKKLTPTLPPLPPP